MLVCLNPAQKKYYKILVQKSHKSAGVPLHKLTYFNRNTRQGKTLLIWISTCSTWMTLFVSFQSPWEPPGLQGAFRAETHLPVPWQLCTSNVWGQPLTPPCSSLAGNNSKAASPCLEIFKNHLDMLPAALGYPASARSWTRWPPKPQPFCNSRMSLSTQCAANKMQKLFLSWATCSFLSPRQVRW